MIFRLWRRFWRWLRTKRYEVMSEVMSEDWMREQAGRAYDDNPRAKKSREE